MIRSFWAQLIFFLVVITIVVSPVLARGVHNAVVVEKQLSSMVQPGMEAYADK
jgi:hypothetical protein